MDKTELTITIYELSHKVEQWSNLRSYLCFIDKKYFYVWRIHV